MTQDEAKKDKELQKLIKRRAKLDKDEAKIADDIFKIRDIEPKLFTKCRHLWGSDEKGRCKACRFPMKKPNLPETETPKMSKKKKEKLFQQTLARLYRAMRKQNSLTKRIFDFKTAEHKLWQECPHKWGKEDDGGAQARALSQIASAYTDGKTAKGLDLDQCIVCGGLFKEKKDDKESKMHSNG